MTLYCRPWKRNQPVIITTKTTKGKAVEKTMTKERIADLLDILPRSDLHRSPITQREAVMVVVVVVVTAVIAVWTSTFEDG